MYLEVRTGSKTLWMKKNLHFGKSSKNRVLLFGVVIGNLG